MGRAVGQVRKDRFTVEATPATVGVAAHARAAAAVGRPGGPLYPSATLHPSSTLYPEA